MGFFFWPIYIYRFIQWDFIAPIIYSICSQNRDFFSFLFCLFVVVALSDLKIRRYKFKYLGKYGLQYSKFSYFIFLCITLSIYFIFYHSLKYPYNHSRVQENNSMNLSVCALNFPMIEGIAKFKMKEIAYVISSVCHEDNGKSRLKHSMSQFCKPQIFQSI